jgi:hypothetical protein
MWRILIPYFYAMHIFLLLLLSLPLPSNFPRLHTIGHSQHLTLRLNKNTQLITNKKKGEGNKKENEYEHVYEYLSFRREDNVLFEIHDG